VKSFTVLSPAPASPGDGRWDSDSGVVVRVVGAEAANPGKTRQALLKLDIGGSFTILSHTDKPAPEIAEGATYKSFGLPAIGDNHFNVAFIGNAKLGEGNITAANDSALVFHPSGSVFGTIAREGDAAQNLPSGVKYSGFSNPVVGVSSLEVGVAFLAKFQGSGVTKANNRALMFGIPTNIAGFAPLARTGGDAPQPLSDDLQTTEPVTRFGAITAFTVAGGLQTTPVFLAKLAGAPDTSNVAVFARGSDGTLRRLLRTGRRSVE
jgi:hypothetical protein